MKDDLLRETRNQRAFHSLLVLILASFFLGVTDHYGVVYPSGTDPLIQQQQLSASDKTAGSEQFGSSVAISGDTALVGSPGHGVAGGSSGADYVFTRDAAGHWTQGQKLTPSNGAMGDLFGSSVALSNDTAFVGARGDSSQGTFFAGAVYVFARDTSGQWSQGQKLIANDGAAGDLFGCSIDLRGDTALIGAHGIENSNGSPGAAYIFTRDANGQWSQTQKLTAGDGTAGDGFGFSAALSDNTLAVGARGADDQGSISGAAYIFTRDANGQWNQTQKLTASHGVAGDEFGYSVATSEDTVLVGARFASGAVTKGAESPAGTATDTVLSAGAVYVFALGAGPTGGTVWNEGQKLVASDGAASDEFGFSVALSGATALVGAPVNNTGGGASGAVYFFSSLTQDTPGKSQSTETQKLAARDGAHEDEFGSSVAFSGDTALVGTPFDDIIVTDDKGNSTTFTDTGSVYTFVQTPLPSVCTIKTGYDTAGCSGTVSVASLSDLDQYVADDFGRKGHSNYQNLTISGSLAYIILDIESPCSITLQSGTALSGDFVSIDGRKGVVGTNAFQNIDATKTACVLSEQDRVELGANSFMKAGELTLQAATTAKIGGNTTVGIDGDLVIVSTGNSSSSVAILDSGSVVTAGSIKLQAPQNAQLGADTIVTATDLNISSPRGATIGKNAFIALSGNLTLESTGNASGSQAIVDVGANVAVAGNAEIVSGNKAILNTNVTLTVFQNLNMQAGKCTVNKSAVVTAGSKSGNCL